MRSSESASVVIIGAGIAGAVLSVALAQAGIASTVIERRRELEPQFRGEIIQPYGVAVLQHYGFIDYISPVDRAEVNGFHVIFPCLADTPENFLSLQSKNSLPPYALTVRHHLLYKALRTRMQQESLIRFLPGNARIIEPDNSDWRVTIYNEHSENTIIQTPIVVAADGYNSLLHKFTDFATLKQSVETYLLGLVVAQASPALRQFLFVADDDWVVYGFPLSERLVRLSLHINAAFLHANKVKLEPLAHAILQQTSSSCGYEFDFEQIVEPLQIVPCPVLRCEQSSCNKLFLAGDALGTINPITGHGLTLACYDAVRLSKALQQGTASDYQRGEFRQLIEQMSLHLVNGFLRTRDKTTQAYRAQLAAWFGAVSVDKPTPADTDYLAQMQRLDERLQHYYQHGVIYTG